MSELVWFIKFSHISGCNYDHNIVPFINSLLQKTTLLDGNVEKSQNDLEKYLKRIVIF